MQCQCIFRIIDRIIINAIIIAGKYDITSSTSKHLSSTSLVLTHVHYCRPMFTPTMEITIQLLLSFLESDVSH